MSDALQTLLAGIAQALEDNIRPGSGLMDTFEHKPTPPDHYGQTSAALALATLRPGAWSAARLALHAWLSLPARKIGHQPFNRLTLLLLRTLFSSKEFLTVEDDNLIDTALARCPLRQRYPSNNWSLLAQTARLIESPPARRAAEAARLCALLKRWTTPAGAFIDFPARPAASFATPIAYHHKALFLTALACWFQPDTDLVHHAQRLLAWLVHCWDPAGYAGGVGRSTHSLFGDGCLMAALILLGLEDGSGDRPLDALCQRLARQRRPDGFLWLNPAGHESGAASWDGYMHLSVYNAWAAAIIGAALQLRGRQPLPAALGAMRWEAAQEGFFHDEAAGLACMRTADGAQVLVSTHGQPPQSFSRTQADFRYAGGAILHLRMGDGPPRVAPALRVGREELERNPALAGWTPLLRIGDEIAALDRFDKVSVRHSSDGFTLDLEGAARAVFRPAPRSLLQRLLATLDWRLLGGRLGRRTALARRTTAVARARVTLVLTLHPGRISIERHIQVQAKAAIECLNPDSHNLITAPLTASGDMARESCLPFPSSLPGAISPQAPSLLLGADGLLPPLRLELVECLPKCRDQPSMPSSSQA